MSIAPLSLGNVQNSYSTNFLGRKHNNNNHKGKEQSWVKAVSSTDLSKMPVMMLVALSPIVSDAKLPENTENNIYNSDKTEMTLSPKQNKSEGLTYVVSPEVEQNTYPNAPFGYRELSNHYINFHHKFYSNGEEYNLIFTSKEFRNKAANIYIIPTNNANHSQHEYAPKVRSFIYHDLGGENDFGGAVIDSYAIDRATGKMVLVRAEMRLDDETSQKIVDLITGHSNLENTTDVKIKITHDANLPIIVR